MTISKDDNYDFGKVVAQNLNRLRRFRRFSHVDLANRSGVSLSDYRKIIKGDVMSLESTRPLNLLASVLERPVRELYQKVRPLPGVVRLCFAGKKGEARCSVVKDSLTGR